MTLVDLHVDMGRVADALEKIAFLLEKLAYPPLPADLKVIQATLDDLHVVSEDDILRQQAEQMAFAELHRVVPGSEAYDQELINWQKQQRNIHGEKWEAPDWAEAFIRAAGGRPHREPADEAAAPAGERS